jgi:hypothetical protein
MGKYKVKLILTALPLVICTILLGILGIKELLF